VLRGGKPVVARLSEDVILVSLPGGMDADSIPSAEQALASARPDGAGCVIIDLAAVSFIDSATLTMLVRWADELTLDGGQVVVTSDDPRVARQFAIGGFDRTVRIERTLMQAVDDLVAAAPPPGAA
jgi:anti-anti-sigma factor